MANAEFDNEQFERRLQALKDSQESIQGLSAWCLERRQHHKKIVATWLQVLKKVKVEHRLTLFYLANDVIQYSKRKNFEFVESWGTTLQRATTMVRDEKVKHRILRIFKIWDQRQVYDEEFLADLSGLISAAPKKKPEPQPIVAPEEFQSALLISTMRSCANLEQATDARLRDLRDGNVDIDNAEELCASLKDRRHVEDAEKEVDSAVRNVESYVKALEAEIRERTQVLELLEQADSFYETQRSEVKIVTNAYRNFGSRVKNLKKKLDELLPTLISPIPSPDMDAPSPSPDSDIELPGDDGQSINQTNDSIIDVVPPSMYNSYGQDYDPMPVPTPELATGNSTSDFTNNFSSFMGGNVDFDMRNLFNDRSETPSNGNQRYNDSTEAMPIEVISMRPTKVDEASDDFSISNFLKTVLPGTGMGTTEVGDNSGRIPGLGPDAIDSRAESPLRTDYGILSSRMNTPPAMSGRMIGGPSTPQNNHQMIHSTPLAVSRSLTSESHTPSPYSSQNSLSNMTTLPFVDSVNAASPVNPLPPPPLPPPIFLDEENCYNKLPPKFPTWTSANEITKNDSKWDDKSKISMNSTWSEDDEKTKTWTETVNERWDSVNDADWPSGLQVKNDVVLSETPESPPIYEKSSFNTPIEYNDVDAREPILSSDADVDHRVRTIPMPTEMHLTHRLVKAADVDHRNLISLTGSPANNASNSIDAGTSRPNNNNNNNNNNSSSTISSNNNNNNNNNSNNNNNNVWTSGDQNYRRQQGDIVESVDMEMSDEEGENKQKCRVLVDVRSQQQHQQQHDRDLRIPVSQPMQDLDMRMIPLPGNPLPRGGPMLQNIRPPPPPPPPPPQQFRRGPPSHADFQGSDFHQQFTPEIRQNLSQQQIFMQNQSSQPDFHVMPQDFHSNQLPKQMDFHQHNQHQHQQQQRDYDFHENMKNQTLMTIGDFMPDGQQRSRFPGDNNQSADHHIQQLRQHRESMVYHRNPMERGSGHRGRGFPRTRRDRFADEQNSGLQQRNLLNNRRPPPPPPPPPPPRSVEHPVLEKSSQNLSIDNRASTVLQLSENCVVIDDNGSPTTQPNLENSQKQISPNVNKQISQQSSIQTQNERTTNISESSAIGNSKNSQNKMAAASSVASVAALGQLSEDNPSEVATIAPTTEETSSASIVIDDAIEKVQTDEIRSHEVSISRIENEPSRQLSEHLEALMNEAGRNATTNLIEKFSANGNDNKLDGENTILEVMNVVAQKKPSLLPNGPCLLPSANELHPVVIYDYDVNNQHSNYRPRIPGIVGPGGNATLGGPFPMWRGGVHPLRARGGFRGAPRAPWLDRGPNFAPRGNKRGGPGAFRGGGGGFRGRGRGNAW